MFHFKGKESISHNIGMAVWHPEPKAGAQRGKQSADPSQPIRLLAKGREAINVHGLIPVSFLTILDL